MSPGRISASTSSIAGGPNAMCTISGSSHSSAARRARRSGSRPLSPTVGVPIRTLTPRTRSRLRSASAPEEVDVEVREVRALVVLADEPDVRDVQERRDPHARAARRRTRAGPAASARPPSPRRSTSSRPDARGDRVGVDAPVGDLVEDVRVQVDEPGRDDLPRRRRSRRNAALGRDVAVDGGDPAARDRDVEAALCPPPGSTTSPPRITQVEPHRILSARASSAARIQVERLEPHEAVVVEVDAARGRARGRARTFAARFSGVSQSGGIGRSATARRRVAERARGTPRGRAARARRRPRSQPPRPRADVARAGEVDAEPPARSRRRGRPAAGRSRSP